MSAEGSSRKYEPGHEWAVGRGGGGELWKDGWGDLC